MSKAGQAPIGFVSAPPPSAPPSYSESMGGVAPQAPFYPQQPHMAPGYAQQQQPFLAQPGNYPPQAGAVQVMPTTIVTTVVPLGPQSTHMVCPHCHAEINTTTTTSPSNMAYISSLIICLLGCPLGCCLIPCCIPGCMNVKHKCPSCKQSLGKFVHN